jgi:hypothetical protein
MTWLDGTVPIRDIWMSLKRSVQTLWPKMCFSCLHVTIYIRCYVLCAMAMYFRDVNNCWVRAYVYVHILYALYIPTYTKYNPEPNVIYINFVYAILAVVWTLYITEEVLKALRIFLVRFSHPIEKNRCQNHMYDIKHVVCAIWTTLSRTEGWLGSSYRACHVSQRR